jgi:hypothetical protein
MPFIVMLGIIIRSILLFFLGDFVWYAITGTHNYLVVIACCLLVDLYASRSEVNTKKKL